MEAGWIPLVALGWWLHTVLIWDQMEPAADNICVMCVPSHITRLIQSYHKSLQQLLLFVCVCICTRDSASELFNIWRLSVDRGLQCRQLSVDTFILRPDWFHLLALRVLSFPTGNERGAGFEASPSCWGETRRLADIPPPPRADMRDMLTLFGTWDDALYVYSFTTTSKGNVNGALSTYWVHFMMLHFVFVYLKMLWEFHWTCFSLYFCFHIAFFLIFFFYTIHATFLFDVEYFFFLITLHAVLKWSFGKVEAEWINVCVFVCVYVCVCKGTKLQY